MPKAVRLAITLTGCRKSHFWRKKHTKTPMFPRVVFPKQPFFNSLLNCERRLAEAVVDPDTCGHVSLPQQKLSGASLTMQESWG